MFTRPVSIHRRVEVCLDRLPVGLALAQLHWHKNTVPQVAYHPDRSRRVPSLNQFGEGGLARDFACVDIPGLDIRSALRLMGNLQS